LKALIHGDSGSVWVGMHSSIKLSTMARPRRREQDPVDLVVDPGQ